MFFCYYTPPPPPTPIQIELCRTKRLDGHPWEDDWNKEDDWDKECIDLPKGVQMSKQEMIQHLDAVIMELTIRSKEEWYTKAFDEEIEMLHNIRNRLACRININN